MKEIKIPLGDKSYNVYIGHKISSVLIKEITGRKLRGKILVVTDRNVNNIYRTQIEKLLHKIENKSNILIVNPGEESKSPEILNNIYSFLIANEYGRDSLIIAFGGGIVGDLAGYAAASYMRGIPFIQIPTTLLAAVDSSVGGKTGINFKNTKNIIGAFHQPLFVLADMVFLKTLPDDEILCGAGEIIKYAFLATENFYKYVEKNIGGLLNRDPDILKKVILESIMIKGAVVSQDEKESGIRKILNLGHTFAHGFESVLNYNIKHGEAVIAGIGCSLFLSRQLNIITEHQLKRFLNFISKAKVSLNVNEIDKEQLLIAMQKDKKNREGKIKLVLVRNIGEILTDIETDKNSIIHAVTDFGKAVSAN